MEVSGNTNTRKETGYRLINVDTRGKPYQYRVRFNSEGRMQEGFEVHITETEDLGYRETVVRAEEMMAQAQKTIEDLRSIDETTFYRKETQAEGCQRWGWHGKRLSRAIPFCFQPGDRYWHRYQYSCRQRGALDAHKTTIRDFRRSTANLIFPLSRDRSSPHFRRFRGRRSTNQWCTSL